MRPLILLTVLFYLGTTILWSQEKKIEFLDDNTYISKGLSRQYELLPHPKDGKTYSHIGLTHVSNDGYQMTYFKKDSPVYEFLLDSNEYAILKKKIEDIRQSDSEALDPNYYGEGQLRFILLGAVQGLMIGLPNDFIQLNQFSQGVRLPTYMPSFSILQSVTNAIISSHGYVRPAMIQMPFYGSITGYVHGYQLSQLISPNPQNFIGGRLPWRLHLAAGTAWGESILNYFIAKKYNFTKQEGIMFSSGGILGNFAGYHLGRLSGQHPHIPILTGFAGYIGGSIIGPKLLKLSDRTAGDYKFISYATLLGATSGYILSNFSGKPTILSPFVLFGTASGLALGILSTRDTYFDGNIEVNLAIGTGLGALSGLITSIPFANNSFNPLTVMLPMTIAGFSFGYFLNKRKMKRNAKKENDLGYQFNINPFGLSGLSPNVKINQQTAMMLPPAIQLQMTF